MRRRLSIRTLTIVCSPFLAAIGAAAEPETRSAADLIALAPVIRSSDERCRSIDVAGTFRDGGPLILKFRAIYRAPDRHALILSDGADDTPLLWASGDRMIIYDPVRPVVLYHSGNRTDFQIWQEGDDFKLVAGFEAARNGPSRILFDVGSLFTGGVQGDEAVAVGPGEYRLTRTSSKGNFLVAHIDTRIKQPYQKLELIMKGGRDPSLRFDRIVVDGALGDEEFAFPAKERLAARIAVKEAPGDGLLQQVGIMALAFRACYARLAANVPEMRGALPLPGLVGIDWDEVRRNDRMFSQVLKDVIPARPKTP
jgi:hypothetical protein